MGWNKTSRSHNLTQPQLTSAHALHCEPTHPLSHFVAADKAYTRPRIGYTFPFSFSTFPYPSLPEPIPQHCSSSPNPLYTFHIMLRLLRDARGGVGWDLKLSGFIHSEGHACLRIGRLGLIVNKQSSGRVLTFLKAFHAGPSSWGRRPTASNCHIICTARPILR